MILGLLAGIWPCGIITILDELFKTESKSQVYGCLHGFVHCNRENTADIGKNECTVILNHEYVRVHNIYLTKHFKYRLWLLIKAINTYVHM